MLAIVVGNHSCATEEFQEIKSRIDCAYVVIAINAAAARIDEPLHCLCTHHREEVLNWVAMRKERTGRTDLNINNCFTINGSKVSTSMNQFRVCLDRSGSSALFGTLYACRNFAQVVVCGVRLDGPYLPFRFGWHEAYAKNLYGIREKCRGFTGYRYGYVGFIKDLLGWLND